MTISSLGVGSGLDLSGLLDKLMEAEKIPLTSISTKAEAANTKLSAYSLAQSTLVTFQGSVSALSSLSYYQKTSASVGDTAVATVSAGTGAASGSYSLTVNSLAQSQRLASSAVASKTDNLSTGAGTIKIALEWGAISGGTLANGTYSSATFTPDGKGGKTIELDASKSSLTDIRDAINQSDAGLTATIVNDGGGYRLSIANSVTGEDHSLKISVSDDTGGEITGLLAHDPAGTQALTETQAAQNAHFTLDGIAVSKPSNTVSDMLEGVTLTLLSTNVDKSTSISVSRDTSAARSAADQLVSAYNTAMKSFKDLTAYDAENKSASVLTGDSGVRSVQSALSKVLTQSNPNAPQGYRNLADIGITLQKDGTLAVDSAKLDKAVAGNYDAVVALFAQGAASSDPGISVESTGSLAQSGKYQVEITQVATKGFAAFDFSAGFVQGDGSIDLSTADAAMRTMMVSVGGASKSITLDDVRYGSANDLASALQTKINEAFNSSGVSLSVTADSAGRFTVTSGEYGSQYSVHVAPTAGLFDSYAETAGMDVAGRIDGRDVTGSGQTLTGAAGTLTAGLKLKITAEAPTTATISFSQGAAYQFDQVASSLTGETGPFNTRIDGLNKTLESLTKQYSTMEERINATEMRYRAQFTSLDSLVSKLNATSSYLTQQLSAISAM
ncbi:MAG: flagellar filament capping protein FliD, partial [Burkholderiaceae bacterium]|nr:flagellar filament capping protein FliD [Burkholderiaceae bacterium]